MPSLKNIILIIGVPLVVALTSYIVLSKLFLEPLTQEKNEIPIVVVQGMFFNDVAKELAEKKVIRSAFALKILSRLRSEDTNLKVGEYVFSSSLTPKEVLQKLIKGDTVKRLVTVVPGTTTQETIKAIAASGVLSLQETEKALKDKQLIKKWGLPQASINFDGYLLPETYSFSKPITADEIVGTMIKAAEKIWTPSHLAQAESLKLSRDQVLVLASIIEKETAIKSEMPLISSVFHNRLKSGMKLQSDPTVIYGIPNYNGNIKKSDLEAFSPYNTYVIPGLPPTPIAHPSEDAIEAALYPATSNYLFFVADGNGGHRFSATYREHRSNVDDYIEIEKKK